MSNINSPKGNGTVQSNSGKGQGRGQGNAGGWPSATGKPSGGNRSNNPPRNK